MDIRNFFQKGPKSGTGNGTGTGSKATSGSPHRRRKPVASAKVKCSNKSTAIDQAGATASAPIDVTPSSSRTRNRRRALVVDSSDESDGGDCTEAPQPRVGKKHAGDNRDAKATVKRTQPKAKKVKVKAKKAAKVKKDKKKTKKGKGTAKATATAASEASPAKRASPSDVKARRRSRTPPAAADTKKVTREAAAAQANALAHRVVAALQQQQQPQASPNASPHKDAAVKRRKTSGAMIVSRSEAQAEERVARPWTKSAGGSGMPPWKQTREAPPEAGTKERPSGNAYCLWGKSFLITGTMPAFEREDLWLQIARHGGKVVKSVAKKLTHAVIGAEPGPSKMEKIEARSEANAGALPKGTTIITPLTEDELLALIRELPAKKLTRKEETMVAKWVDTFEKEWQRKGGNTRKRAAPAVDTMELAPPTGVALLPVVPSAREPSASANSVPPATSTAVGVPVASIPSESPHATPAPVPAAASGAGTPTAGAAVAATAATTASGDDAATGDLGFVSTELWVERYKPKSSRQLVGNADKVTALRQWLQRWPAALAAANANATTEAGKKAKKKAVQSKAKGAFKRAALLSGVPGIGKTSAATLIAKEAGYNVIEFNASDARSKKAIQEMCLATTQRSIGEFYTPVVRATRTKKQLILMDEVDGMSSGDRGGMVALVAMIEATQVPIICMCNDVDDRKMSPLKKKCLHLSFEKPGLGDIRNRMLRIAENEGFREVDTRTLDNLVQSVNADVRQVLHTLQFVRTASDRLTPDVWTTNESPGRMGLIVPRSVPPLLIGHYETMSLRDKQDLYFVDSHIVPLYFQTNYLKAVPKLKLKPGATQKQQELARLEATARAAELQSEAELVGACIMQRQQWGLSPLHALMSTVMPAAAVHGRFAGYCDFPQWLGKQSQRRKRRGMLSDLQHTMRHAASGTTSQLRLDYAPLMTLRVTQPLEAEGKEGVPAVIGFMQAYGMKRSEWEALLELTGAKPKIASAVKAAFTRRCKVVLPEDAVKEVKGKARGRK